MRACGLHGAVGYLLRARNRPSMAVAVAAVCGDGGSGRRCPQCDICGRADATNRFPLRSRVYLYACDRDHCVAALKTAAYTIRTARLELLDDDEAPHQLPAPPRTPSPPPPPPPDVVRYVASHARDLDELCARFGVGVVPPPQSVVVRLRPFAAPLITASSFCA